MAQKAAWMLLGLLLAASVSSIAARQFDEQQQQQSRSPASDGRPASASSAAPTARQATAAAAAAAAATDGAAAAAAADPSAAQQQQQQQPRRMMVDGAAAGQPLANTQIPVLKAMHLTKLGRDAARSKPLGTALNGSMWQPGACGAKPTSLGYQCSWTAPSGAVLHWSYTSGGSAPPINRCTMQQQAVPNLEMQELSDATLHVALQVATREPLHLVFLDPEGRYYPNEGVHGSAQACGNASCTSEPDVQVLYQAAPGASDVTGRPSARDPSLMEGWAGWASADADGSAQILCVSRHLHSKFMRLQSDQQPSDVILAYATGSSPNYMARSRDKGIVLLNLLTGEAAPISMPTGYLVAHGALMLIAFGVLLPTGLLLARHKWLFVDEDEGLSPLWGISHMVVLLAAALVALLGMVVALVRFGNSVSDMVMSTHQVLGLLSVGLSLVLVVMYGLRPFILSPYAHRHAPSPLLGPQKVGGCVTVAAGWASLFLGCVVIHRTWGVPHFVWLVPCTLLTGLVAAAASLLELRYQKLLASGCYNPKTAELSPGMPVARILTHREPTNFKKHEAPSSGGGAPLDDGQPGSSGGVSRGMVAAAMLARSMFGSGQHHSDAGLAGHRGSTSLAGNLHGRASSSSGGGGELMWRRGRHSSPNAAAAAAAAVAASAAAASGHLEVQTGFPSNPGRSPLL